MNRALNFLRSHVVGILVLGVLSSVIGAFVFQALTREPVAVVFSEPTVSECKHFDPKARYQCFLAEFLSSIPRNLKIWPHYGNNCMTSYKHAAHEKIFAQEYKPGGRDCELQAIRSIDQQDGSRMHGVVYLDRLNPIRSCYMGRPTIMLSGTRPFVVQAKGSENLDRTVYSDSFQIVFESETQRDSSLVALKDLMSVCM